MLHKWSETLVAVEFLVANGALKQWFQFNYKFVYSPFELIMEIITRSFKICVVLLLSSILLIRVGYGSDTKEGPLEVSIKNDLKKSF